MKIFNQSDEFTGWAGETPYFLVINTMDPKQTNIVDLDEAGWMWERDGLMRATGEWVLVAKRDISSMQGTPIIAIRVLDGEQPYYTKRHIGMMMGGAGELMVYGIGKKRVDGHVDRLWILPNGIICAGDDVDIIGVNILKGISGQ